jgi:hypothetical protein
MEWGHCCYNACVRKGTKMNGFKMCGVDGLDYSASHFDITDLYESVEVNRMHQSLWSK